MSTSGLVEMVVLTALVVVVFFQNVSRGAHVARLIQDQGDMQEQA